jgi:hypothetical protein
MKRRSLNCIGLMLGLLCCAACSAHAEQVVEPGPENGGLRLRLMVTKRSTPREGGFDVRLEVINASADKVTLRTGWESNEEGDVKDYLRLHASVETYPPIEPEKGATGSREVRTTPQKELTLAAGETLSLNWQSTGRRLKTESVLGVENPELVEPGLYSVHVTLNAITATGTHRLRSNEQLVMIGGSAKQPRHTYGHITSIGRKVSAFSLGSLDGVKVGDEFAITSKSGSWKLTVVDVGPRYSDVTITGSGEDGASEPQLGAGATLVREVSRAKAEARRKD